MAGTFDTGDEPRSDPIWKTEREIQELLSYRINIAPHSTTITLSMRDSHTEIQGTFIAKIVWQSCWLLGSELSELVPKDDGAPAVATESLDPRTFDETHYPPFPQLEALFNLHARAPPYIKKLNRTTYAEVWPKKSSRPVRLKFGQYQCTRSYEFSMPVDLQSDAHFSKRQICLSLGIRPVELRCPSECDAEAAGETAQAVELSPNRIKLSTPAPSKKVNLYPKIGLIEAQYNIKYQDSMVAATMRYHHVEPGSVRLMSADHHAKRSIAYSFVLVRNDPSTQLAISVPLHAILLLTPAPLAFEGQEALNVGCLYLALILCALIGHRRTLDTRTVSGPIVAKHDQLFVVAVVVVLLQALLLVVAPFLRGRLALLVEEGLLILQVGPEACKTYAAVLQSDSKQLEAFAGSSQLRGVYVASVAEWLRLQEDPVEIAGIPVELKLKSFVAAVAKMQETNKVPTDLLRARLVGTEEQWPIEVIKEGLSRAGYNVKPSDILFKRLDNFAAVKPGLGGGAGGGTMTKLRFQLVRAGDAGGAPVWIELQRVELALTDERSRAYKAQKYSDTSLSRLEIGCLLGCAMALLYRAHAPLMLMKSEWQLVYHALSWLRPTQPGAGAGPRRISRQESQTKKAD